MTLGGGRLHRQRLGVALAAVIRTGLACACRELHCRPRRVFAHAGTTCSTLLLPEQAASSVASVSTATTGMRCHPALRPSKPCNGGKLGRPPDLAPLAAERPATLPGDPFAHAVSEREPDGQGEGKLHHHNTIALDISVQIRRFVRAGMQV
jgi:hypothetical protein